MGGRFPVIFVTNHDLGQPKYKSIFNVDLTLHRRNIDTDCSGKYLVHDGTI